MSDHDDATESATRKRQSRALELRRLSKSYQQIADELGFADASGAYRATLAAEKRELVREADGLVRGVSLAQIEACIASILPKIIGGVDEQGNTLEPDDMLILNFVRLDKRRARLLGLDAPEKHELVGTEIVLDVVGVEVTEVEGGAGQGDGAAELEDQAETVPGADVEGDGSSSGPGGAAAAGDDGNG